MQIHHVMLAAVMTASVPAVLSAQSTSTGSGQTTAQGTTTGSTSSTGSTQTSTTGTTQGTTTTASGGQTTTTTSQSSTSTQTSNYSDSAPSRWIASGFVGANYSNNTASLSANAGTGSALADDNGDASADFGFSLGYLWRSVAGAEFLAGFTPNFEVQNNFANINNGDRPQVNSYMFNAMGAIPLGAEAQWQPFVSGGFGAITLRADESGANDSAVTNFFAEDETRAGGNIGVGLMGFAGNWGFRGDVRYFHAFDRGDDNTSTAGGTTASESSNESLPGLNFWRANIGVAFRW
jgi:hypothetical protein